MAIQIGFLLVCIGSGLAAVASLQLARLDRAATTAERTRLPRGPLPSRTVALQPVHDLTDLRDLTPPSGDRRDDAEASR